MLCLHYRQKFGSFEMTSGKRLVKIRFRPTERRNNNKKCANKWLGNGRDGVPYIFIMNLRSIYVKFHIDQIV